MKKNKIDDASNKSDENAPSDIRESESKSQWADPVTSVIERLLDFITEADLRTVRAVQKVYGMEHKNIESGAVYGKLNSVLLAIFADKHGYTNYKYGTVRQWNKINRRISTGARAVKILRLEDKETGRTPVLTAVFNIEQSEEINTSTKEE